MKQFQFTNSLYTLSQPMTQSPTGFISIWKVSADDSYTAIHTKGFTWHGIFLTIEGQGVISFDTIDKEEILQGSSFFLLPGNTPCSYRCLKGYWKFYFINFSEDFLISDLRFPLKTVMNFIYTVLISHYCQKIIETLVGEDFGFSREADMLFQQMLIILKKESKESGRALDISLARVIKWIHENQNLPIRNDELLKISNLSRSAFYRAFKDRTGKTPGEYILNLKIKNASNLLNQTNLQIKQIAAILGFYDEFYFSSQFKRIKGVAPSLYKKNSLV